MTSLPPVVEVLSRRLRELGWVTDLLVGGSLATGDYVPFVSDVDLVALVSGRVDASGQAVLTTIHRELDLGPGVGLDLGCVYVDEARLGDVAARHPTWTHRQLVQRILSGISRAELVQDGFAVYGRSPADVLPAMSQDDVRAAGRAEATGYWARAARRPIWWLDPDFADLGLTSMARARHSLRTGELLTKSRAIEQADAPPWLVEQMRARRRGEEVGSPRLRTALIGWRDARRTVARARA